jgi:hypothetical protein
MRFEDILVFMETRRMNDFTLPVPKEMHKMVTFILEYGKKKSNIFLNSGNAHMAK